MPNTTLNGIDLYYEVHGPDDPNNGSPPLMLIAGLASDSQSWLPVLTQLAESRMVILFDNRGCGRTSPQYAVSSIHLMAADCIALADHLGIDRFDLLGHSMGGLIAIDCASHHPGRIRRLALVNCAAANTRRNQLLFDDWGDALRLAQSPERWFRNFFYWIFTPRFFEDSAQADEFLKLVVAYPYPQMIASGFGLCRLTRFSVLISGRTKCRNDRRERLPGSANRATPHVRDHRGSGQHARFFNQHEEDTT